MRAHDVSVYHLEAIRIHARADPLDRILSPIADAIRAACATINDASSSGDEDYATAVIDDECDLIENLIGVQFIAAQTFITSLVSASMHWMKYCKETSRTVDPDLGNRYRLLDLGRACIGHSRVTEVRAIDAVANYFKHHEEWRGEWGANAAATAQQQRTTGTVMLLGLSRGSTGNLRQGFRALAGDAEFDQDVFTPALQHWAGVVTDKAVACR